MTMTMAEMGRGREGRQHLRRVATPSSRPPDGDLWGQIARRLYAYPRTVCFVLAVLIMTLVMMELWR